MLAGDAMSTKKRKRYKFEATLLTALAGALSGATLMCSGTQILGHMRPMWMELSYTFPAALVGLVLGAAAGLLVDLSRMSQYRKNSK